jgi:hypothetical protein
VAVEERQRLWSFVTELDETDLSVKWKKAAYIFMGLLVVYVIVRGVVGAASRLFWFDELFTLTIANQPSLHDMWRAITSGFDSAPPLFYLVERAALDLTSNQQIALRIPSILAFPCTLICLFVYAKKRNGELLACLCALLFLSTSLFHTYLIDARAYSMVVACIAFALVCYQRLASPAWTFLFGFALFLAESLHYYALFAMIPFWFAESLVFITTRKFRWPTWIALFFGILPVILCWPLLMTFKKYYGPNIFARPDFSAVRGYYATFFLLKDNAIGIAAAFVAVAAIVWCCLWGHKSNPQEANGDGGNPDLAEAGLLLSFIALPVIVLAPMGVVHGILLIRYVMTATIGLALGITMAISIAGRKATVLFAMFVVCLVGVRESSFWFHREYDPFIPYFSATSAGELQHMSEFMESAGHPDLPMVVSDCLLYSQFVYYSEAHWKNRLVYLADERRELHYTRADTSSKSMLAFREFFPLRVVDYSEFTTAHPEFLLYSEGLDWYIPAFLRDGFTLQLVANDRGKLYVVRVKEPKTATSSISP